MSSTYDVICLGAGPAGLTAAHTLVGAGQRVLVVEQDASYVGGISRTVQYKGFRFDIGGHRFFSKSRLITEWWHARLGNDFLTRPRKSRIYFRKRFFRYPIEPRDALRNLGVIESLRCVLSYAWRKWRPIAPDVSFESWVTNRFGDRLFRLFFKTYTEKVWGMPCSEISADWAAQRIKGLSLTSAIRHALFPKHDGQIKTLIHTFEYPRLGPGMMWERVRDEIIRSGGAIRMGAAVDGLRYADGVWHVRAGGEAFSARQIVSSIPLQSLCRLLGVAREAADSLHYRDFIVVALIVRERHVFDDNWIYIHEPDVRVGRIQNFKSWSPEMVPDPSLSCYGMEYFCHEGDGLWQKTDAELVALAARELVQLKLADAADIIDGAVIHQPKAYPVYDQTYQSHVDTIRAALAGFPGLQVAGRNGMHKYNNQDHAMMTGLLAAKNILEPDAHYDVWLVNQDAEYLEELSERIVPQPI